MIVTMKELLKEAQEKNISIGAFGVANMEMIIGTIRAAEEKNTPIIIQIAQARLKHSPLEYIGPMMVEAAKRSKVNIAVHLDHGLTIEVIKQALDYGFTSVMFDGSKHKLTDNIKMTNEVIELANKYGASTEAELGVVGGSEGLGYENIKCTDVNEAIEFCQKAKVDALAVAIGNVHGEYKGDPNLNFEILKNIYESVDIPLVLHGGSGISDEDFQRTIKNGVRKINIATANLNALIKGSKDYLYNTEKPNYFDMNTEVVDYVKKSTMHLLDVFSFKI